MELDKEILEKICYDQHNSGSKHPVPVSFQHYEIIVDLRPNSSIDWVVRCVYRVPMNVNGVVREGWSYNGTVFVNQLEYKREKTRSIRESKLKALGL